MFSDEFLKYQACYDKCYGTDASTDQSDDALMKQYFALLTDSYNFIVTCGQMSTEDQQYDYAGEDQHGLGHTVNEDAL